MQFEEEKDVYQCRVRHKTALSIRYFPKTLVDLLIAWKGECSEGVSHSEFWKPGYNIFCTGHYQYSSQMQGIKSVCPPRDQKLQAHQGEKGKEQEVLPI